MNKYLFAAVIILAIIMCTKREPFVEIFGFAGYKKPSSVNYDDTPVPIQDADYVAQEKFEITPDIVNSIVQLIQKYVKDKQNLCIQPLETSYVKKFIDKTDSSKVLYKARMMFMAMSGFPYGVAISADVLMSPTPILVRIQTQPNTVDENIIPYQPDVATDFVQWEEIIKVNKPLLSELKTDENLLGKIVNGSNTENPGEQETGEEGNL